MNAIPHVDACFATTAGRSSGALVEHLRGREPARRRSDFNARAGCARSGIPV
jgi:hypothetical protein